MRKMAHEVLPDWPRLMGRELAAAYLDISPSTFDMRVATKQMPPPIRYGRRVLWDRQRIDRMVDIQSGLVKPANSWDRSN